MTPIVVFLLIVSICGCDTSPPSLPRVDPSAPTTDTLPAVPEQSEPEFAESPDPVDPSDARDSSNETERAPADEKPPSRRTGAEQHEGDEVSSAEIVPTDSEEGASRYEFRDDHDPNGIGKFYMGREIAHVMGFAAAPWLERPEREKEEATSKLIKALALEEGMFVADIGAGSGVLTLPIAGRVGRKGRVFAVDVQQEMLDLLDGKLRSRQIENVVLVLGTDKNPRLEGASLDLALMVDVYHEFAFPYEMLLEISKAMKPGGRVVFVEFRMEDPNVPIKLVHKMTEAQVKKEVDFPKFRLKWKDTIGTLPWQHVIVFEKLANEPESEKE